jgi:hypothetical protein
VVWQTAQFPIAASSAPFATRLELKAEAFAVSTGSICGFHINRVPTTTQTTTITSIALTILRTVIGSLGPFSSLRLFTQTPTKAVGFHISLAGRLELVAAKLARTLEKRE